MLISPSLLSCDFGNLQQEIQTLNNSDADWYHLDIMDGVFVPNISYGFPVIKTVQKNAQKPLDVHLMIVNPDNYIQRFIEYGAQWLTVHIEACMHLHRIIDSIKKAGIKAGVALNPHTPVCMLEPIISFTDMVLIMSVNPGFGGQSFIENTYKKIAQTKELILKNNSQALIQVDGGVTDVNAKKLKTYGADVLVAGSFVFKNGTVNSNIQKLKQ